MIIQCRERIQQIDVTKRQTLMMGYSALHRENDCALSACEYTS